MIDWGAIAVIEIFGIILIGLINLIFYRLDKDVKWFRFIPILSRIRRTRLSLKDQSESKIRQVRIIASVIVALCFAAIPLVIIFNA
jgi:hypothetical protein